MNTITLVVPYFNEAKNIESCIHSILKQSQLPNEVVFVDNQSTDDSAQIIADYLPQFRVPTKSLKEEIRGIPFTRNKGVREAKSDIVAFLDGDCAAPEEYIELFQKGFQQEIQSVTGKYVLIGQDQDIAKYRQSVWGEHFGWDKGRRIVTSLVEQDGTLVSGCSAFFRDVLTKLGLFDKNYLFMDDIAISEKFYRRGYKALMDPSIVVKHKIDTSEISLFRKDLHYGYDNALINLHIRNRRIKFYPHHYHGIIIDSAKTVAYGDSFAFYRLRTLVYHKLGLLLKGLSVGSLYFPILYPAPWGEWA